MFYVFNTNGRLFDGPLEQLRQVENNQQTSPTRDSALAQSLFESSTESVTEKGTAVSPRAIAQYKASLPQQAQREMIYHVYQVMSQSVQLLELGTSLQAVYQAFLRHPFSAFPVVNRYQQLASLVRRDTFFQYLLKQPLNALAQIELQQADELLQPEVISTAPVTDVRRAAQILVEREISSLPVVDQNGNVIGVVAKRDILSCLAKDPPLSIWC